MRVDRRVILVGEDFGNSNPRYHSDLYALTGLSGERLASLSGESRLQFYMLTDRTNVVTLPAEWRDRALVAAGVQRIMERAHGQQVILLGSKVAAAFDSSDLGLYRWYTKWLDVRVARMPHPSGRNYYWNDPANVERARAFLTATMRKVR